MTRLRLAAMVLLPVMLAGCDSLNSDHASPEWTPKGLNAANLAAMVQDPADLARGHHDPGPERKLSAKAVNDLWTKPPQGAASGGGAAAGGGASAGVGFAPGGPGN